jgi:hypothetical protein
MTRRSPLPRSLFPRAFGATQRAAAERAPLLA